MSETWDKISDLFRVAMGKLDSRRFTSAIIVAGGSSTRMGGGTTKQMLELCGTPVVVRTLIAFEKSEYIDEIIVVAKADETECYKTFKEKHNISKLTCVTEGGATRQDSVLNGFEKVSSKADFVAIHDAARCFVTGKIIEDGVRAAYKHNAVCVAIKSKDTAKYADSKGYIERTIDREYLWNAQTPQIFKTNLYRAAAYFAKERGIAATDDCMLAEAAGFRVKLVEGSEDNIKITTPHDLELGEMILKKRGEL